MLEKFIENFLMKSRTYQQDCCDHILEGRCKDYAEYKHFIGKLKGMKEADKLTRSLYTAMIDRVVIREKSDDAEPERY